MSDLACVPVLDSRQRERSADRSGDVITVSVHTTVFTVEVVGLGRGLTGTSGVHVRFPVYRLRRAAPTGRIHRLPADQRDLTKSKEDPMTNKDDGSEHMAEGIR